MNLLIGLDIGTSGVKALLINDSGETIFSSMENYPLSTPKPGWAEQDADLWWNASVRALRKITASGKCEKSKIAAISFSGQMHGLVPLDNSGQPLRPAILWCDQRPVAECEWLQSNFGDELLDVACNPPLAGFTLPKILWMKNHESSLYGKIATMLLPKDYVRFRLTGEKYIDISDASGTIMLDVEKGDWAYDLLNKIGISADILPPVVGSEAVCGKITREAAALTGLPEGTPVVAGGADNTCAAIGAGIVHPGVVSSSIGSSGVIFAHCDKLRKDPLARVHAFNHSVPGAFYQMGVTLSAGLSFKWFKDNLGENEKLLEAAGKGDAYALLSKLAEHAPPGSEGLLFLPYLNGERTPHRDPHARGAFFNISLRHGKQHMIRALMEGIVFSLKDSLDIIMAQGDAISEIRATGGGGKSTFWRQMQADIFGVPVCSLTTGEGPALGAALLAGVGVGIFPDAPSASDSIVKTTSIVHPNPELKQVYAEAHERYKNLYPAVKELFVKS